MRLALWTPTKVELGAVGFMNRGKGGSFVTLFNAFSPPKTGNGGQPMFHALSASIGRRLDKTDPPAARKRSTSLGARIPRLFGIETPKSTPPPVPENADFTFKLRYGHKQAFLFTESTLYQYMESLDGAKAWFTASIDSILHHYGRRYKLQREDVILGTNMQHHCFRFS